MPSLFTAAKGAIVLLSTATATANLALSVILVPRLLESPPSIMLAQWRRTFVAGMRMFRPAFVCLALGFLAVAARAPPRLRPAFAMCAALNVAVVPYTYAVMMSTNRELLTLAARADEEAVEGEVGVTEDRARRLVDNWGMYNLGRAALGFTASALGMAAILS